MKPSELKRNLLQTLRGPRSQMAVSRKMGYSFNQVYRWEAGLTRIMWSDFVQFCSVCKAPLKAALENALRYFHDPQRSDLLIGRLLGRQKLSALSCEVGLSRYVLSDWLKGSSEPPLDFILDQLHKRDHLIGFVKELVDITKIPRLADMYNERLQSTQVMNANPMMGAVAMGLLLDDYYYLKKHKPGLIARWFGMTLKEEEELLRLLLQIGVIQVENGRFRVVQNYRRRIKDPESKKIFDRFWLEQGLTRNTAGEEKNESQSISSVQLLTLTKKSRDKILEAYQEFSSAVAKIVLSKSADQDPATVVQVLTVQFYNIANTDP